MTSAGDLLINEFRLEQEFSKIDLSKADDDVLEEWRLHRKTVECMAKDYASAVSRWREALEAECRAATWE